MKKVVDLPILLHEITRWALPFLTVSPEVKRRAEVGLLTPDDCMLIAEQLGKLGRSLTTRHDSEEATRLGEETVELIRLAQDEEELQEFLQTLYAISRKRPWQAYLQFFLSLASPNGRPH